MRKLKLKNEISFNNKKNIYFSQRLIEFIDDMIMGLEIGNNLNIAFQYALENVNCSHMRREAQLIVSYNKLGMSFSESMVFASTQNNMSAPFQELLDAILLSTRYGSPLLESLIQLNSRLRSRVILRLEELASEAPVKMIFPLVFFIFPVIFVLLGAGALRNLAASLHF